MRQAPFALRVPRNIARRIVIIVIHSRRAVLSRAVSDAYPMTAPRRADHHHTVIRSSSTD